MRSIIGLPGRGRFLCALALAAAGVLAAAAPERASAEEGGSSAKKGAKKDRYASLRESVAREERWLSEQTRYVRHRLEKRLATVRQQLEVFIGVHEEYIAAVRAREKREVRDEIARRQDSAWAAYHEAWAKYAEKKRRVLQDARLLKLRKYLFDW